MTASIVYVLVITKGAMPLEKQTPNPPQASGEKAGRKGAPPHSRAACQGAGWGVERKAPPGHSAGHSVRGGGATHTAALAAAWGMPASAAHGQRAGLKGHVARRHWV